MKKRKLSILICCLLGFTLISCSSDGSKNKNNVNDTSKVQESKTPEESKTVEEDKTIKESETVETNEQKGYKLRFGELLDSKENGDILIIKAKIKPSYNNKATIDQNGFNVEDLILNQGADKFNEIQYWAVADMADGSENKVISFTLDKSLIDKVKAQTLVGNMIVENSIDTYILPSLQE